MVASWIHYLTDILMFLQKKGWDKILEKLTTAAAGTRAWPNRTKDHNVSFRVDYGPLYKGHDGHVYRNLDVQPNKGTKNTTAAAVANADSHQVLGRVAVRIDEPPSTAAAFLSELSKQLGYDLVFILVLLL
jgi:hypothetical protein